MLTRVTRLRHDDGFTIAELVIVVLVIGLLAGIAMPPFLARREKAWETAVQSDLRNAGLHVRAARDESADYAAANLAGYTGSAGVTVAFGRGGATFCLQAEHAGIPGATWAYDSGVGGLLGRGSTC